MACTLLQPVVMIQRPWHLQLRFPLQTPVAEREHLKVHLIQSLKKNPSKSSKRDVSWTLKPWHEQHDQVWKGNSHTQSHYYGAKLFWTLGLPKLDISISKVFRSTFHEKIIKLFKESSLRWLKKAFTGRTVVKSAKLSFNWFTFKIISF